MRTTPQGTLIPGHQPMALESPRAGLLFARAARRLAAAAILVGLSTLCLAPAAFAQTQLWTGTREVQQVNSSIVGYSNGVPTAPCTDTSILTDDDFTDAGTGYPFDGIFIRSSGRLELQFTSDLTDASEWKCRSPTTPTTTRHAPAPVIENIKRERHEYIEQRHVR